MHAPASPRSRSTSAVWNDSCSLNAAASCSHASASALASPSPQPLLPCVSAVPGRCPPPTPSPTPGGGDFDLGRNLTPLMPLSAGSCFWSLDCGTAVSSCDRLAPPAAAADSASAWWRAEAAAGPPFAAAPLPLRGFQKRGGHSTNSARQFQLLVVHQPSTDPATHLSRLSSERPCPMCCCDIITRTSCRQHLIVTPIPCQQCWSCAPPHSCPPPSRPPLCQLARRPPSPSAARTSAADTSCSLRLVLSHPCLTCQARPTPS